MHAEDTGPCVRQKMCHIVKGSKIKKVLVGNTSQRHLCRIVGEICLGVARRNSIWNAKEMSCIGRWRFSSILRWSIELEGRAHGQGTFAPAAALECALAVKRSQEGTRQRWRGRWLWR
ncbi:MAG TPA: hypothetical protein DGA22_14270 [Acidobacterium sp.]|nr:hypothetical protein [Acidobacterium sp.]